MKISLGGSHSDKFMLIDKADYDKISVRTWHLHRGGYAYARFDGKMVYAHRLIASPPKGLTVDHINRNKLDNRQINLRVCTLQENCTNRPGGVYFHKQSGKWQVKIMRFYRSKSYGLYDTRQEAEIVRQAIV